MIKQGLENAVWTLSPVGDLSDVPELLRGIQVPARVPGCVHTDLLRAGKIEDPYKGLNAEKTHWIGRSDWEYRCTFEPDEKLFTHERIDLACDGLDTVATITLNGREIARTQNMHRSYRFDVRPSLKRGTNELVITFASPVKYAEAMQQKLGRLPYVNGPAGPFNFIRKMACNFGWDWGPALTTSGIWKGVRLEGWSDARIAAIQTAIVDVSSEMAMVDLYVAIGGSIADRMDVRVISKERNVRQQYETPGRSTFLVELELDNPRVWWPIGHGQQPLYDLRCQLIDAKTKRVLDEVPVRIGLRTVELDTSPDDIGSKFVVKVNGKPIFCKGFNWIPDDCFLDRACDPKRVRERLQQAADAGANMIRVWGGGIYESDEFYDICDELGLMVWQDFLFACAMYPEEEPFWSEVEAEARENVARLSSHPSLVLWNGCNENIWAYRDWGWKDSDEVKGRKWGLGYYLDLLPRVMKEVDPSRPYWAASPWSGDADADNGIHPNADTHGNMHVWVPWFHEDYSSYRKFAARFCSEFGFQGPATYSSIAGAISRTGVPPVPVESQGHGRDAHATELSNALDFGSPAMRNRQRSGDRVRDDGDRRNLRHLIRHFNLAGAQELLDALDAPDPNVPVPYCGSEHLHSAHSLPSKVNFDDLHYLLQLNQARALKLGVEWFRSRQPRCMGTLYWQLNDCWPGATSWSCIDGDGRKKPLWYATRRFFSGLLATFQPEPDGSLSLYLINDSDERHSQEVLIYREDFTGKCLALQDGELEVPPRSVARVRINRDVATPEDSTREFLYANGGDAMWFFEPDKNLRYDVPNFESEWNGRELVIRTTTLLRDVCILVDRLDPDAAINNQLVTMLPRVGGKFVIDSKRPLTHEQLISKPVFRCANEFGRR